MLDKDNLKLIYTIVCIDLQINIIVYFYKGGYVTCKAIKKWKIKTDAIFIYKKN